MSSNAENAPFRPLFFPAIAERLVPRERCDSIVALAHETGFRATAVQSAAGTRYDSAVRQCEAVALDPARHRDIYTFVREVMQHVNRTQYRFAITGLEPVQVLRYTPGSFFREHSDLGYQHDDSINRKISLIAQLSADDAYAGGRLVLFGDEVMPRTQGTVCAFPSWLPHRVEPLTAGVRYTLVAWAKGPPFS